MERHGFKLRKLGMVVLASLVILTGAITGCGAEKSTPAPSGGKELTKIKVSLQPSFESFASYDGAKKGWDKEAGFTQEMVYFDSGMPQIAALPANGWDIGATGNVPMLLAALKYDSYFIGIADDESAANTVMVRGDSPLLTTKNANGTYGTAEQLKGKTILTTTVSSGHYAVSSYLKSLGLTDNDVKIMNLEQAQAVAAYDSGEGDLVGLWAPFIYTGLSKGWKNVATGQQLGVQIPLVIIANKKFADEHPEEVVKFLEFYFRGIDQWQKEGNNLAEDYVKFQADWCGTKITKEDAILDIATHPVYNLKEQLEMFDSSKGPSKVQKNMQDIADFFTKQGKLTEAESKKVMNSGFITDKFLKMLAEKQGAK